MSSTHPLEPKLRSSFPPEAWEPFLRLARVARRPLLRFMRIEAASGILLLAAAAIALFLANSPWAEDYLSLWHTPIGGRIESFRFERPLEWLVNDGLMVIFFFVVGMEIGREVYQGELSEWRRAGRTGWRSPRRYARTRSSLSVVCRRWRDSFRLGCADGDGHRFCHEVLTAIRTARRTSSPTRVGK